MMTTDPTRRTVLARLAAGVLAVSVGFPAMASKDDDALAPVVPSGDIVQKLISKDIVLDPPGQGVSRNVTVQPTGLSLRVHFAFGSARLLTQGQRQLDQLAAALTHKDLSSFAYELAGHTDAVGSHATNMRLSLERAKAAKAYLVQTHGLSADRLKTIGFGFTRLANAADPTSGANRRVEVRRLRLAGQEAASNGTGAAPAAGTLVTTPKSLGQ
jgi:outer membrane protein OmpA-like peptidoglycan-associated protein